jgi:hypothetical protein
MSREVHALGDCRGGAHDTDVPSNEQIFDDCAILCGKPCVMDGDAERKELCTPILAMNM